MNKPNATASVTKNGWLILTWAMNGSRVVAVPPGRFTQAGFEPVGAIRNNVFIPDGGASAFEDGKHALSCAQGRVRSYARGGRVTIAATIVLDGPCERNGWRDAVYATLIGRGATLYEATADLGVGFALTWST